MIGQTISHYKVLEKLGEGGMGVVYKAEDLMLHRLVALKFPSDVFVGDQGVRERFLSEARMAARFMHQNVTAIHAIGEHEGRPFIVMEFVDGATLRRAIMESGPLPLATFISLAIQLCEGLKAVHEQLVLHRDIKTENILVNNTNQVKIADCGLAARFIDSERLEKRLGLAGTTPYMSPEQIRGERLDQRSDVFSIGIVLYEMLTGRLPFEAEHPTSLMYLITNADPVPLTTYRNDIPPSIEGIVKKALEKNPEARYQHVAGMIQDLRAVELGDGGVQ